MIFEPDALEDRLLARYEIARDAGYVKWVGLIGSEEDANNMPKLPGIAILLRRGIISRPETVDGTRQLGRVHWSIFAAGENVRLIGKGSGRRGPGGAYAALKAVLRFGEGFLMTHDPSEEQGFPLSAESFDLAGFEQKTGRRVYEVEMSHDWFFVEDGFD